MERTNNTQNQKNTFSLKLREALSRQEESNIEVSDDTLLELVKDQFDEQTFAIVEEVFTGSSLPETANKYGLDLKEVQRILKFVIDLIFIPTNDPPLISKKYIMQLRAIDIELLDTPIALENRLSRIAFFQTIHEAKDTFSASEIATQLDADLRTVNHVIASIGLTPVSDDPDRYESYAVDIVEEELAWKKVIEDLPEQVSAHRIAELLARKTQWVHTTAQSLGAEPLLQELDRKRPVLSYNKSVLEMLRHVILLHSHPLERHTVSDLVTLTGKRKNWVKRVLSVHNLEPLETEYGEGSRVVLTYDEAAVTILQAELSKIPEAAGNRYTAGTIAELIGRTVDWVNPRLEAYIEKSDEYLDNRHRSSIHYDEEVYQALKKESIEQERMPYVGDWLSLRALARSVGHSVAWVQRRLPYIACQSENRQDDLGRVFLCYEPKTVEMLLNLPEDILKNA